MGCIHGDCRFEIIAAGHPGSDGIVGTGLIQVRELVLKICRLWNDEGFP